MKSIASSITKNQWSSGWKPAFQEKLRTITFGDLLFFGMGIIPAWALVTVLVSFIGGEL